MVVIGSNHLVDHIVVCVLELLCCVSHLLVSPRFGIGGMFVALCLLTPCSS